MLKDKTTTSEALNLSKLFNKSSKSSSPIVSEEDISSQKYNRARAYFKGVQSLPIEQQKEFEGVDEETRDNDFKNKVFTDLYKYDPESSNMILPEDKALWDNRKNLNRLQRDIAVAKKALTSDIDNISNVKEQPLKFTDLNNPEILAEKSIIKSSNTARDQAMDFLTTKSEMYVPVYQEQYKNLSADQKQLMRQNFLNMSKEISPYFENYYGTDKLPMDEIEQDYLISNFESWNAIGGPAFASKKLSTYYQNKVAENQSFLEKTVNTGAKFVDSAAGMILRGVGMLGATVGFGLEEGEGWLENVIDNDLTRYADRIATTNSYDPKEQKRLESIGMSDNPVLNTVEQEQSMITMNTPFEVIGQYGFTAATTLLSFGGAGMVSGSAKVLGATAKAIASGKALNTTSKGIQIARAISKAKDIGNLLVVGGIAGIEGGMNAASTKKTKLDAFNQDIDSRWDETISNDIYTSVASNPSQTLQVLASQGYQIPSEITTAAAKGQFTSEMAKMVANAVKSNPDLYKEYADKYTSQIEADKQRAETDANKAMYVDFAINSAINGIINATLQKTLNAAPIQKTLNKWGIRKNPLLKEINISNTAGKWSATPIKHTGWKAVKNRLRESTGEAIEEYTQDLSSATAQGYAEDQMKQYIDYKYNNHDVANALEEDTSRSVAAGLESLGESVTSFEAIKAGLYGGLSTFIGGPNVNSRIMSGQGRGEKGRKEGEGAMAYFARRNPIGWRSGITPFFNNSEIKAVNEQREKLSSEINNFMSDEKVQDLFFGNAATTTAMAEEQKSVEERDEFEARNQRFMVNASQLATLNTLKGTVYHDAVLNSLKERINFDEKNLENPESIESKSVEQFLNTVPNDASQDKVEALTKIKKNSQEMMEQINLFNKESEKVDKAFGRTISKDAKEAIIIDRLGLEDTHKRIKQIDEELNQVKVAISSDPNAIDKSSLNKDEKILYVHKKFENPDNQILSASEIIDLPAKERSIILDPKFSKRFSPEQLVEVEKVRVLGLQVTPEFNTKIEDRAKLEFKRSNTLKQQAAIIEDPQKLEAYITVRKMQKSISLVKKKYDYLNQYTPEEYAEFSDQLSNIETTETSERMMTIREFLKGNPLYTKYIGKQKEENDFYQTLSKNDNFTSMDLKKRDLFGAAYKYLSSKDIDMNDPDAVTLALSEQTQDGKLIFEDFIQSFNSTRPENAKVTMTDVTEVIQNFNTITKTNSEIKAQQSINTKTIPVTPVNEKQNAPSVFDLAADDVNQETGGVTNTGEKVVIEETTPAEVNPIVQKFNNNSSSEVGEITSQLIKDIETTDENKVSTETKDQVLSIVDELSNNSFDNPVELADAMIARAAKMQAESEDDTNLPVIRALNIFATRLNLMNERKKSSPVQTTTVLTTAPGTTSSNARMEGLSLNQVENKVNSPNAKFAIKHKIKEFLNKTVLPHNKTKVMFMIDPELDAETKASMANNNYAYKPLDNSSIVAVVESPEGQIIINDNGVEKRFQPIAIMPATGNKTYSGAERMGMIRKHASNQPQGQLIKDEKGNVITTALHGPIKIVSPKKISESTVGATVIDVLINEAPADERIAVAGASKTDRKYNSVYQKLKKSFLDKFEVVKMQKMGSNGEVLSERKVFMYDANGAKIEIWRRSIENTTARNSNKLILDLFRTSRIKENNRHILDSKQNIEGSKEFVSNQNNEIQYQLPQGREIEEFVASEKTIRDLAARMSDRIGIPVKYISDRSQYFKGKLENGTAVINLAYATLDTPIHEILGHAIIRAIKNGTELSNFKYKIKELNDSNAPGKFQVETYSDENLGDVNFFDTEQEAKEYVKSLKLSQPKTQLYQNLLKELEYGKGKEVLDRIKRDYGKLEKRSAVTTSNFENKTIRIDGIAVATNVFKKGKYFSYTNKEGQTIETIYTQVTPLIQELKNKYGKELEIGNTEEVQEEAIVELLGLYTADRLDRVKDGKLISLLKRLLKEMKAFMKQLLGQKEVEIDKLPDNMTLGNIADLLAYSNSKLIFPGNEVIYTTPDNQQFKTYAEANKHISDLAKSAEDVDLSNIELKGKRDIKLPDYFQHEIDKAHIYKKDNQWYYESEGDIEKISEETAIGYYLSSEIGKSETIQSNIDYDNSINKFIEKNKEYEQSREIIEEWKKVNNIQYNPEEVYSRGQEFVSVVGAYSDFDVNLMMQNLLQHVEDNQKAGGEFTISAFTKPVNKQIGHLEGGGGKIKFKLYPQSNDILWAANTDVFSGSVWDASEKVNKDKKSELLGVSYTKYPSLRNINEIQPNLASIIDNLAYHHNELGITLTGSNFRLEYDDDIPYSTKKIINSINSILDQKYGKVVKPVIENKSKNKEITLKEVYENIKNDNYEYSYQDDKYFNKLSREFNLDTNQDYYELKSELLGRIEEILKVNPDVILESGAKQPIQTNKTLKESIQSIKNKISQDLRLTKNGDFWVVVDESTRKVHISTENKQEAENYINKFSKTKQKEYTEQALINTKIAKLKEVAKKYPRSLIRSEVKPINSNSDLGFTADELPFQKVSGDSFQQSQQSQYVEALTANSRISGYQKALSNTLKGLSKFTPEFVLVDGNLVMSENSEGAKVVTAVEKQLNTKLNDFLYISSKDGQWSYKLTPAVVEVEEGKLSPKKLSNGKQAFTLNLVNSNTGNNIELGEVGAQELTHQIKFSILKNLLIEPSTNGLRKLSNGGDMIMWQISNRNIEAKDSRHLSDIFDDDILEVRHEGIQPEINVGIQSPFDMSGQFIDRFGAPQSTNSDNASDTPINSSSKAGEIVTGEGAVVNELLGKEEKKAETILNRFQKLVNRMLGDAVYFEKSTDEKYYVNVKTGDRFLRVTSVISADAQADERFDPKSPYAVVSSNIGTGVDTFVRDFFEGKINPESNLQEKYPNANDTDLKAFYQQLLELKNRLAFEEKTIISAPIIAKGKVKAIDSKGNPHEIPVAGTIDLLVYDERGNFEIIDIKTSRQPINGKKLKKYTDQLSMYSKFLEETYGIKVKSISILPVTVKYNDPAPHRPYTVKEGTNQVMIGKNEIRTAQPILKPAIKVTPSKSNIVFDKLTAEEQQIVKESIPASGEETTPLITDKTKIESVKPVASTEPVIDSTLGLPMEDFNPWGDDLSDSHNDATHEYVPSNLKWGVWSGFVLSTGEVLNAKETQKVLTKIGFSEESWDSLGEDFKKHLLECNGV